MQPAEASPSRFVRRTILHDGEYRKNFRQIDRDAIEIVTSEEACRVTKLMSKVYLRLIDAPTHFREVEGVLRFTGEEREEEWLTAWEQLISMLGVASATAQKALNWMHERGVIGYDAHRNGVGIRIFVNRATTSIGKGEESAKQKNLRLIPTSSRAAHTSPGDTPFKDTFGVRDNLELEINPHAPKNGAVNAGVGKTSSHQEHAPTSIPQTNTPQEEQKIERAPRNAADAIPVEEIVNRLRSMLEPALKTVAVQTALREHERTREWLDRHGIPKATRVAQREAYNVLRKNGVIGAGADSRRRADLQVGGASEGFTPQEARSLSEQEIIETAETCAALLEAQGKAIEVTLSEISSEAGGWLLPEDAPRVREAAQALLLKRSERR
ncbi:MAG: hypothetical protein M3430_00610 [Acidobacteriota bacterium]|nr:hypothetical protein [Acidobacteriota bacterium]